MTPEIRRMLLAKLMFESDQGCPSGFRSFPLQRPTEQEMIERLGQAKLAGSVLRKEVYQWHSKRRA